jgi:hypothetical protein
MIGAQLVRLAPIVLGRPVYGRVVQQILTFFPRWEGSLIPFYGILWYFKFKLLGYHLRVPQAPLFRPKNTKEFPKLYREKNSDTFYIFSFFFKFLANIG